MNKNTLTTTLTDKEIEQATTMFNHNTNKYAQQVAQLATELHQTKGTILARLLKTHLKNVLKDKQVAEMSSNEYSRTCISDDDSTVDWDNTKVKSFTKWYTQATQPTLSTTGTKQYNSVVHINNDKFNDSLQDAYLWIVSNPTHIPDSTWDYKKLLLGKAKFMRWDTFRKEAGLTTQGKIPKKYGKHLHIVNGTNNSGIEQIYNSSEDRVFGITTKGFDGSIS